MKKGLILLQKLAFHQYFQNRTHAWDLIFQDSEKVYIN